MGNSSLRIPRRPWPVKSNASRIGKPRSVTYLCEKPGVEKSLSGEGRDPCGRVLFEYLICTCKDMSLIDIAHGIEMEVFCKEAEVFVMMRETAGNVTA
jgi:hypothetical protein